MTDDIKKINQNLIKGRSKFIKMVICCKKHVIVILLIAICLLLARISYQLKQYLTYDTPNYHEIPFLQNLD